MSSGDCFEAATTIGAWRQLLIDGQQVGPDQLGEFPRVDCVGPTAGLPDQLP
jgi:hypothetical protein